MARRFSDKLAQLKPMSPGRSAGSPPVGQGQAAVQPEREATAVVPSAALGGTLARDSVVEARDDARGSVVEARDDARAGRLRAMMGEAVGRHRRRGAREPRPSGPQPLPVGTLVQAEQGAFYHLVSQYGTDHCHGAGPVGAALQVTGELLSTLALDPALADVDLSRLLVLDTETTGLAGGAGTVPFLVGLSFFEGAQLQVEQFFLRNLGEEVPLLERLAARIRAASCILSYNGKSFDWPLLRSRFILNRVQAPALPPHLDLLHCARRLWKGRLASMRLVEVEREVLGFARQDDVDGALIPSLYAEYLRGGDPGPMVGVIQHNAWDVVALPAILGWMGRQCGPALAEQAPEAQLAFAQVALRAGRNREALACVEALLAASALPAAPVSSRVCGEAALLGALICKRAGEAAEAVRLLCTALAQGVEGAEAAPLHLALAKLYEHHLHDLQQAHVHAQLTEAAEGEAPQARRLARLQRRLATTGNCL